MCSLTDAIKALCVVCGANNVCQVIGLRSSQRYRVPFAAGADDISTEDFVQNTLLYFVTTDSVYYVTHPMLRNTDCLVVQCQRPPRESLKTNRLNTFMSELVLMLENISTPDSARVNRGRNLTFVMIGGRLAQVVQKSPCATRMALSATASLR